MHYYKCKLHYIILVLHRLRYVGVSGDNAPVGRPSPGQPPVGRPPVCRPPVGQPPVGRPLVGWLPVGWLPVGSLLSRAMRSLRDDLYWCTPGF